MTLSSLFILSWGSFGKLL